MRCELAKFGQPLNLLAGTIKIAEGLASTSRASRRAILPVPEKEDAVFKTMLAAAAVALCIALPAAAQTISPDEELKSHCRLQAAAAFPDERNAFHNEMRSRLYQRCLSINNYQTTRRRPAREDCHQGNCFKEYILSVVKDAEPNVLAVQTKVEYLDPNDNNTNFTNYYRVRCKAPGFIEPSPGFRMAEPEADPDHASQGDKEIWMAVCRRES
jgi:hypothetical protein